jgi:hypothetical protein
MSNEPDTKKPCIHTTELESIKSVYEICIKTRNFEINQLIQRNNFFMLFQGVLLASALQNQASKPVVELIICLTGVLVSYYQLQMACGAKFWQEWWEIRVDHFEEKLGDLMRQQSVPFFDLFAIPFEDVHAQIEARFKRRRRSPLTNFLILRAFQVGRAPIKVSLALLVAWILLTLHTVDFRAVSDWASPIKGFTFAQTTLGKRNLNP